MRRIQDVAIFLAIALFLVVPTAWGADPEVEDLRKELQAKDKVIQELMQRMERLEKEVRETQKVQMVPAAVQAPPSPGAAEKPEKPTLGERIKALEDSPVIKFFKETQIGGYVAATYNQNLNSPQPQDNRFHVFDFDANTFTFNNAELSLIKASTAESPIGFGVVFNVGHDARVITADWTGDGTSDTNTFELQQGYVTYKVPLGEGLDVKLGKWATLLGAEVIESVNNFNISRSYLFGFAIPFTHTGLLLTYPVDSLVSLSAGVVNGWDNVIDNNDAKTFIGQMLFTPAEIFSLAVNGIWGPEQADQNKNKRWVIDVVPTLKPFKDFTLQANFDYGEEGNVSSIGRDAQWWGIALIANYDFTDQFGVALRGEFFNDDDGVRTSATNRRGVGVEAELWETTLTLKYKPYEKFMVRLEYRYDFAPDTDFFFENSRRGFRQDQSILQVEAAYLF